MIAPLNAKEAFGLRAEPHKGFYWVVTEAAEHGREMREQAFGACWCFESIPNSGQNETSDRFDCSKVMGL